MTNQKSLLPFIYQDKQNLALEECIKEELNIDTKKFLIFPIENASDELLPTLAKEFHVMGAEGWNLCRNRKEKINLLLNSLEKHIMKGINPTILNVLKDFGIIAEISEFWEYGGRPAHYIMKFVNIYDRGLTKELEEDIKELINAYAPATRILDYINYFLCSISKLYVSSRFTTLEKCTISTREVVI